MCYNRPRALIMADRRSEDPGGNALIAPWRSESTPEPVHQLIIRSPTYRRRGDRHGINERIHIVGRYSTVAITWNAFNVPVRERI